MPRLLRLTPTAKPIYETHFTRSLILIPAAAPYPPPELHQAGRDAEADAEARASRGRPPAFTLHGSTRLPPATTAAGQQPAPPPLRPPRQLDSARPLAGPPARPDAPCSFPCCLLPARRSRPPTARRRPFCSTPRRCGGVRGKEEEESPAGGRSGRALAGGCKSGAALQAPGAAGRASGAPGYGRGRAGVLRPNSGAQPSGASTRPRSDPPPARYRAMGGRGGAAGRQACSGVLTGGQESAGGRAGGWESAAICDDTSDFTNREKFEFFVARLAGTWSACTDKMS
ncbi:uncharacterized protein [Miscanthus floridulus]|uniref:uncharacterized protein n=1 Tax=Miscanthus floridulus TaxID=154761 RepID=UPI003458387A